MSFWTVFTLLAPYDQENKNFLKMRKTPEDVKTSQIFTINESYDFWFLSYGVQRTEHFVILDHFLPFYPLNNPKNENFEKMKKHLEMLLFYTGVP